MVKIAYQITDKSNSESLSLATLSIILEDKIEPI